MTIFSNDRISQHSLDEYESSWGAVLGADIEETLLRSPTSSVGRILELDIAEHGRFDTGIIPDDEIPERTEPDSPRLTVDEAHQRLADEGLDGKLEISEDGTTERALEIMVQRKRDELARQDIWQRAPSSLGLSAASFGVSFAASMLDPLNVASAFIPVVGPAKYASMVARSGGVAGRAGTRAIVGATEGLAGAALVEPVVYAAATQEQADYDASDSLMNIAFGSVFGGGLHVIGGAAGDVLRGRQGNQLPPILENKTPEQMQDALRVGVGQMATGRNINVDPILDNPQRTASYEAANPTVRLQDQVNSVIAQVQSLRQETVVTPKGLVDFLIERGGVQDPGEDVRAIIGSAKGRPGLVSKKGHNLDDAALSAWEEGYFDTPERPTIRQLLDAIDRDMREKNVFSKYDDAAVEIYDAAKQTRELMSEVGVDFRHSDATIAAKVEEYFGRQLAIEKEKRVKAFDSDEGIPSDDDFNHRFDLIDDYEIATQEYAERSFAPENDALSDFEGSRLAEEVLRSAPADEAVPDVSLEEAVEDAARLADALGDSDAVVRELKPFDELIVASETYGEATRAMALCQIRRGAA